MGRDDRKARRDRERTDRKLRKFEKRSFSWRSVFGAGLLAIAGYAGYSFVTREVVPEVKVVFREVVSQQKNPLIEWKMDQLKIMSEKYYDAVLAQGTSKEKTALLAKNAVAGLATILSHEDKEFETKIKKELKIDNNWRHSMIDYLAKHGYLLRLSTYYLQDVPTFCFSVAPVIEKARFAAPVFDSTIEVDAVFVGKDRVSHLLEYKLKKEGSDIDVGGFVDGECVVICKEDGRRAVQNFLKMASENNNVFFRKAYAGRSLSAIDELVESYEKSVIVHEAAHFFAEKDGVLKKFQESHGFPKEGFEYIVQHEVVAFLNQLMNSSDVYAVLGNERNEAVPTHRKAMEWIVEELGERLGDERICMMNFDLLAGFSECKIRHAARQVFQEEFVAKGFEYSGKQ